MQNNLEKSVILLVSRMKACLFRKLENIKGMLCTFDDDKSSDKDIMLKKTNHLPDNYSTSNESTHLSANLRIFLRRPLKK